MKQPENQGYDNVNKRGIVPRSAPGAQLGSEIGTGKVIQGVRLVHRHVPDRRSCITRKPQSMESPERECQRAYEGKITQAVVSWSRLLIRTTLLETDNRIGRVQDCLPDGWSKEDGSVRGPQIDTPRMQTARRKHVRGAH